MMPLTTPRMALVLGVLAAGLAAQTPTYLAPDDPNPSTGNQGTVKTFYIGPFNVPAARMVQGHLIPG